MYKLTLLLTKLLHNLIKALGIGAGYTWPGHFALAVCPSLLSTPALRPRGGTVLISGTNGKTTTAKLLTHILRAQGLSVLSNTSGANLVNGVASALLLDTDSRGKLKSDICVFEVDELALPELIVRLEPNVVLMLNLSRDQLDRYGEVDTIVDRWRAALEKLNASSSLILDCAQEEFLDFPKVFTGKTLYFDADPESLKYTKLLGDFNAKNVNAAITAAELFHVSKTRALQDLKDFDAAWGRGEVLEKDGVRYRIFLAKNPTSFDSNLQVLVSGKLRAPVLLFVLNDNIPDGRDVSWIYDISPEKLVEVCAGKTIFVSGTRALDMAVRLRYAGVALAAGNVLSTIESCVEAIKNSGATHVLVYPNYSAMLDFRKVILGRKIL